MNLLILGNCFSFEIKRSLLQYDDFSADYKKVDIISTYLSNGLNQDTIEIIKSADLIITQNPKEGHWANTKKIIPYMKISATLIKTEFWRFNGFWPNKSKLERVNPYFWFPVDEYNQNYSFEEYINIDINANLILNNFNCEIEKLNKIDSESDISMFDFFYKNHKKTLIFSDEWHPYPIFFQELAKRIVLFLGYKENDNLPQLNPLGINNDRHRIVPTSVLETLGVSNKIYRDDIVYFGKKISIKDYYYFCKSISSLEALNKIKNQKDLVNLYLDFISNT